MDNNNWISTCDDLPNNGEVVETKIHDEKGERNVADLKLMGLPGVWMFPDASMYVYYMPTHWRRKTAPPTKLL